MSEQGRSSLVVLTWTIFWGLGVSGLPAMADNVAASRSLPLWCATAQHEYGGTNDWVKLSEQSVHVARASMQDQAKAALVHNSVIEIAVRDAGPYLRDGERLSGGNRIYLVRAAAFYVNDKYELPKPAFRSLPFDVSYSQSRHMLSVSNFALGYPGVIPANLALLVESADPVARAEAACLQTQ